MSDDASTQSGEQSEEDFLASYDPRAHPPVAVTVDVVLLTIRDGELSVLLVERGNHPFKGCWALPGGFVEPDETLDEGAWRELAEETGVSEQALRKRGAHLEQLHAYGDPGRDPRQRTVTVAYLALIPDAPEPRAGSDAAGARYRPLRELALDEGPGERLAFDHDRIIRDAVARTGDELETDPIAAAFLSETFALEQLRRVYELVWGVELRPAEFRTAVLAAEGFVEPADGSAAAGSAPTYRLGPARRIHPPLRRPSAA